MKIIVLFIIILNYSLLANEITVNINNIKSNKGEIFIGLFTKDNIFPKTDKAFQGTRVNISDNFASWTFKNLQNNEYAIALYHDENSNKKLDENFLGIPKEGYGFSNNVKAFFAPPSFKDAKFVLIDNKTINIKISY